MNKGQFGHVPDPPEPVECNAENYNFHDCYYCVNRDDCKKEFEEHDEGDD